MPASPLQACPHCGTRVLPTGDGMCPACLRSFAEPPADRPAERAAAANDALYNAAVVHWRVIGLTIGQIALGYYAFYVRRYWPRQPLDAAEDRELRLQIVYFVLFSVVVLLARHMYRLASWLRSSAPILWALATFIPVVNLIAILRLTKASATAFELLGYRIYVFGPRLGDIRPERELDSDEG